MIVGLMQQTQGDQTLLKDILPTLGKSQRGASIDNSGWSMLSARQYIWTSTKCDESVAYYYDFEFGTLFGVNYENAEQLEKVLYHGMMVSPITIYEF